MTTYARISTRTAYLNTEFGLALAVRKLGKTAEEIEAVVGRYVSGKRKGELRGTLVWKKVESGGWCRLVNGDGFVVNRPGFTFGYHVVNYKGETLIDGPDIRSNLDSETLWSALERLRRESEKASGNPVR